MTDTQPSFCLGPTVTDHVTNDERETLLFYGDDRRPQAFTGRGSLRFPRVPALAYSVIARFFLHLNAFVAVSGGSFRRKGRESAADLHSLLI
ncbi:hypothetical protein AAC387_Pa01g0825 [Persea americana]